MTFGRHQKRCERIIHDGSGVYFWAERQKCEGAMNLIPRELRRYYQQRGRRQTRDRVLMGRLRCWGHIPRERAFLARRGRRLSSSGGALGLHYLSRLSVRRRRRPSLRRFRPHSVRSRADQVLDARRHQMPRASSFSPFSYQYCTRFHVI